MVEAQHESVPEQRKPGFFQRHPVLADTLLLGRSVRRELSDVRRHNRELVHGQDRGVSIVALTPSNIPLQLQAVSVENSDFYKLLQDSLRMGMLLTYQEYTRTPDAVRKDFGKVATENGDLRQNVAIALMQDKQVAGDTETIERLRAELREFINISSPTHNPVVEMTVNRLNAMLAVDRERYVLSRLLIDRTSTERGKVLVTSTLAVAAGVAAGGLNLTGLEGPGLAVAGQTDDVFGAVTVSLTENSGLNKIWGIIKDNKITWVFVGLAVAGDLTLVPVLFERADGLVSLALASGAYWLTATAGSMIAEGTNFVKNARTVGRLDKLGKLPGKEQLMQDFLPFRNSRKFQRQLKKLRPDASITDFVRERLKVSRLDSSKQQVILDRIQDMENRDRNKLLSSLKRVGLFEGLRLGFGETLSNPYRSWLFKGLGVSFLASLGAGLTGLLPGRGILTPIIQNVGTIGENLAHGLTESFVGPIETFTAIIGSEGEARRYDKERVRQLTRRARPSSTQVNISN